jgi:hypothetical protein
MRASVLRDAAQRHRCPAPARSVLDGASTVLCSSRSGRRASRQGPVVLFDRQSRLTAGRKSKVPGWKCGLCQPEQGVNFTRSCPARSWNPSRW